MKAGQLIDYRKKGTGGFIWGRIQYIDDTMIKIGSPTSAEEERRNFKVYKRKQQSKNKGSWYRRDELEILSD